jgi:aryl-alcohol dehydrogenase-like predicted oxidoreductase
MPLDHYVTLGRSGLRVSPFCLGAMSFGEDWGWGASVAESEAMLDHYLAAGGNFVDTANVYTKGHSERIIGDYFARTPGRRDRVVIATKFAINLHANDPNGGGAGRKSIVAACEESLRRLQTDYIDLYWMHAWDRFTPIDETMRALDDLVRAGKVRYIGFSDTPAWKTAEAQVLSRLHGVSPLAAVQVEYSLLQRTIEGEIVPMAQEMGMAITPWSPLKGGLLSGKYTRDNAGKQKASRGAAGDALLVESTYQIVDELIRIGRDLGTSPARVALAWVQSQPGITSTILGVSTVKQLQDNIGALELQLAPEHLAALGKLTRPALNFPFDYLKNAPSLTHAGATVNGQPSTTLGMVPKTDAERF